MDSKRLIITEKMSDIYVPEGREVKFVHEANEFMKAAKEAALSSSTDAKHPTGAVIVRDGKIIGKGANISQFHEKLFCVRKFVRNVFPVQSGKGYWMCPGCSPKYHAEQTAIWNARKAQNDLRGSDLYLWGHYWCCHSCWDRMIEAGVENVYLMEGAEDLFRV